MKEPLIEKMFKEYQFEGNDVDFISALIKYMKSIYNNVLIDTLIQFEKENILSTKLLCSSEMRNDYFNKIYEKKINDLNTKEENFASFSQNIKINKILGISYPFIISVFFEINNYTNTLIEKYLDNDDYFRNDYQPFKIEEYIAKKNNFENNLIKEFEKQYFYNIFSENDNDKNINLQKLQQILFNDYMIYYLSKSNDSISNKNILSFFDELFKLFLSREKDDKDNFKEIDEKNIYSIKNISKFVLFIESYKKYIFTLIKLICKMDLFFNDFITDYIKIISLNIFQISNKDLYYVNNIFFNIFESMNYCIINNKIKFRAESTEKFNYFLNEIQVYTNIIENINIELTLSLKHILYLFDFIQVKESFYNNSINLRENLLNYWDILKKEDEFYLMSRNDNNENINNSISIIKEEFAFLNKKLSNRKENSELISKLLKNKLRISKDIKYKIEILKILLSDNLYIIKNKSIFETLLNKYDICPEMKDEKKDVDDDSEEDNEIRKEDSEEENEDFLSQLDKDKKNSMIEFLNKSENIYLDEIFLSLFDGKLTVYFQNIKNKADLILNKSFDIFKKCINYIENKEYTISNNKLSFLYCISFIKYYCYYMSKIIKDEEFQVINKNEIYAFLNGKSNFRKVIKIYILKILNLIIEKIIILF